MTRFGWVSLVCVFTLAPGNLLAKEPYRIPAFWTEPKDNVAPRNWDFTFDALHFSDSGNGWVVGHPFALEVHDQAVSMTVFHDFHFYTVTSAGPGETWIGGARFHSEGHDSISRGVLWHRRGGKWREQPVRDMHEKEWSIDQLDFATEEDGWGIASIGSGFETATVILHYDGSSWTAEPDLTPDRLQWQAADLCVTADGRGWIVGRQPVALQADGRRYAVALVLRDGRWVRSDPPESPHKRVALKQVSCEGNGGAIATGFAQNLEPPWSAPAVPVLLRYTDRWEQMAPPDHLRGFAPNTVAIVSENDFWLAGSNADFTPTFVHVRNGSWTEVPAPVLPSSGRGYSILALSFPSADEGWAAATDYRGMGIRRGLLLHYKDGVWRNRNWDWHFWHERGWGLIGP